MAARFTPVKRAALFILLGVVASTFWLQGCATVVHPPAAVADPVKVAIIDYGYHASLAVPGAAGVMTEYTFGEWGWYVENRTGWWRVPGVLMVPRRGALGTRRLTCNLDELAAYTGAAEVLAVRVERAKLDQWLASMNAAWKRGEAASGVVANPVHETDFVACEESYWVFHTCNAAVAAWLCELGCEVDGVTVSAEFRVEPAARAITPGGE